MSKTVYYAIGDIHGEFEKLIRLHNRIRRTHLANYEHLNATIIHLGDYVDRGRDSYNVIETLINMENSSHHKTINLKGNHEQMMIEAMHNTTKKPYRTWLSNGGQDTLDSYKRGGYQSPTQEHLDWVSTLPSYHWDREANLVFVHAGIDPTYFPNDGENRHLWTRSPAFFDTTLWDNPLLDNVTLVHGHTPTKSQRPDIDGHYKRINIDTGACFGGQLTAVVLAQGHIPRFLSVS